MTIKTKYDVGNNVYVMHKNAPTEAKITHLGVSSFEDNINYPIEDFIYYFIKNQLGEIKNLHTNNLKFSEKELFESKEDLFNSFK